MRFSLGLIVLVAFLLAVSSAHAHYWPHCRHAHCKYHVVRPFDAHLRAIAWCESRRRWHIDGTYDGGLQFSPSTWAKTGSRFAYAYQAPVIEQKYRAVIWASKIGWAWHSTAGWPVCG